MAPEYHALDVRPLMQRGVVQQAGSTEGNVLRIDRDVFDALFPELKLKPVEQSVYLQFHRNSYGRGLNCAQVSSPALCRLCNVSHSTVRTTIHALCVKGCLQQVRRGIQHDPPIYRVLLPAEILSRKTRSRTMLRPFPAEMSEVGPRLLTFAELSIRSQEQSETLIGGPGLSETVSNTMTHPSRPGDEPLEGESRDDRRMV